MIRGSCRTNLDDYHRVSWPEWFVAVPRKGERVRSLDGQHSLKVVGVTHAHSRPGADAHGGPYIIVELHKEGP